MNCSVFSRIFKNSPGICDFFFFKNCMIDVWSRYICGMKIDTIALQIGIQSLKIHWSLSNVKLRVLTAEEGKVCYACNCEVRATNGRLKHRWLEFFFIKLCFKHKNLQVWRKKLNSPKIKINYCLQTNFRIKEKHL